MSILRLYISALALLLAAGCGRDRWEVDPSSVQYESEFKRLDRAVFALPGKRDTTAYAELMQDYGAFFDLYTRDILQLGPAQSPMTKSLLLQFATAPEWVQMQEIIESKYADMGPYERELRKAFSRYGALTGQKVLPELIAYNSGFNYGIYPTATYLGVGLEWYCGSAHPLLDRLPPQLFPMYKRAEMAPEYLSPNAVKGWLSVQHQSAFNGDQLLNHMAFSGKVLYTALVMFDSDEEARMLNYTEAQLQWCRENEFDIWKHLLENDLLYSDDPMEVNKLMNDGPFTPGMPPESPGGVGQWVGLQMVKAFMDANEQVGINELFKISDDQVFLKFYKPGL